MGFGRNLTIGTLLLFLIYSLSTEFLAEYIISEKDTISDYISGDNSSLVKSSHKSIYYKIPQDWLFIEVSKRTPGVTKRLLDATKDVEWLHENYDLIEKSDNPKKKMYLYAGDYPYLQVNENTIESQCNAVEFNLKNPDRGAELVACYLNTVVPNAREQYSTEIINPFGFSGLKRFVHRFYIDDIYYTFLYDCPKDDCDDVMSVGNQLMMTIHKK